MDYCNHGLPISIVGIFQQILGQSALIYVVQSSGDLGKHNLLHHTIIGTVTHLSRKHFFA